MDRDDRHAGLAGEEAGPRLGRGDDAIMAARTFREDEQAFACAQGSQGRADRTDVRFAPVDGDGVTGTDHEPKDGVVEEERRAMKEISRGRHDPSNGGSSMLW